MSEEKVTSKYYLLYNNKAQEKLLTTASSEEKLIEETSYYSGGTWFEYDTYSGSNLLFNEKVKTGIKFPKQPKEREYFKNSTLEKPKNFWVK
jgi:hypothetical protein